jgi:hypothetical protein
VVKLINAFLSNGISKVSNEGEINTPTEIQAGVPQCSLLSPTLYNSYINDTPKHLAFFVDDTSINTTDRKEGYFIRML